MLDVLARDDRLALKVERDLEVIRFGERRQGSGCPAGKWTEADGLWYFRVLNRYRLGHTVEDGKTVTQQVRCVSRPR